MNTTNRKIRPQPALASLTDAERDQIAEWLRHQTYEQVRQRVAKSRDDGGFDLRISIHVLEVLRERTATAQRINDQLEDKLNLTELLAAQNGQKVNWSEGTHELVQHSAFKIALLPDQAPAQLLSLIRIADHPRRVEMDDHRKYIADERLQLGKDRLKLAQKLADKKLSAKTEPAHEQEDDLGPYAETDDDVSERLRIQFNISKEEAARRAALTKAWREEQAKLSAQQPQPASDLGGAAHAASGSSVASVTESPESVSLPGELSAETQNPASSPTQNSELKTQNSPSTQYLNLVDFLKDLATEFDTAPVPTPSLINTQPSREAARPSCCSDLELRVPAPCQNENRFNDFSEPSSAIPNENCSILSAQWNSVAQSEIRNQRLEIPVNPVNPVQNSSTSSKSEISNHPSEIPSPLSLLDRVNQYNLARNREAEHGKNPNKVGKWNAWNFKSKMQFCPCGHATLPCPQHGWFRPEFFELSCDSADYWAVLDAKKLPYTALCQIDVAERDRLERLQKLNAAA